MEAGSIAPGAKAEAEAITADKRARRSISVDTEMASAANDLTGLVEVEFKFLRNRTLRSLSTETVNSAEICRCRNVVGKGQGVGEQDSEPADCLIKTIDELWEGIPGSNMEWWKSTLVFGQKVLRCEDRGVLST